MQTITNNELEEKIERLKIQIDNLEISLPFSIVEKSIRATGVTYRERDSFLYSELALYNIQSNYATKEMTLFKSGEGLKIVKLTHAQYVVIQKLLNQKRKEKENLEFEISRLSEISFDSELENE